MRVYGFGKPSLSFLDRDTDQSVPGWDITSGLRIARRELFQNLHTAEHLSKDGVLPIELGRGCIRDKELAANCVGPGTNHGNHPGFVEDQGWVDFREQVIARASIACPAGVAGLNKEVRD